MRVFNFSPPPTLSHGMTIRFPSRGHWQRVVLLGSAPQGDGSSEGKEGEGEGGGEGEEATETEEKGKKSWLGEHKSDPSRKKHKTS
jgi:hypothetical protein